MTKKRKVITFDLTKWRTPYNAEKEKANNLVGSRISEKRKKYGFTLITFSKLLSEYGVNISAAGLNKWEMGLSVPNAYQLIAVVRALDIEEGIEFFTSNYNRPILNEEGQKKVADYKADLIASGKYRQQRKDKIIEYTEMPVSYYAASAGTGEFLDESNFEMVSFPSSTVPTGAEFGLRVNGDSMEPVYHDGQIVWVQACTRVNPGEVGIFIYDGDGYIKVYDEQEPETPEDYIDSYGDMHMQPVLVSYNKEYAPKPVSPNANFQIVGRVVQ